MSNIDFNSAALDLIESSKGVSLTPEQRARVADKNRVRQMLRRGVGLAVGPGRRDSTRARLACRRRREHEWRTRFE